MIALTRPDPGPREAPGGSSRWGPESVGAELRRADLQGEPVGSRVCDEQDDVIQLSVALLQVRASDRGLEVRDHRLGLDPDPEVRAADRGVPRAKISGISNGTSVRHPQIWVDALAECPLQHRTWPSSRMGSPSG